MRLALLAMIGAIIPLTRWALTAYCQAVVRMGQLFPTDKPTIPTEQAWAIDAITAILIFGYVVGVVVGLQTRAEAHG